MDQTYTKLISLLQKKRASEGLSIRKVAEKIGVSFATISRLERGQTVPDDATVAMLVEWLGSEADDLNLPAMQVNNVHFRAAKNVDGKTVEALSALATLLKNKKGS